MVAPTRSSVVSRLATCVLACLLACDAGSSSVSSPVGDAGEPSVDGAVAQDAGSAIVDHDSASVPPDARDGSAADTLFEATVPIDGAVVGDATSVTDGSMLSDGATASDATVSQVAAPTGLTTNPAGPSNQNSPLVMGSAPAGSTIRLYTNATCNSAIAASGSALAFASPGLSITVADNTVTTVYATATIGNSTSPCSGAFATYVEDSAAPTAVLTSSNPVAPSASTSATLSGTTEAGAKMRLYTSSTCSDASPPLVTADANGNFTFSVTVGADSTTTYYVTATDGVGNVSACSPDALVYVSSTLDFASASNWTAHSMKGTDVSTTTSMDYTYLLPDGGTGATVTVPNKSNVSTGYHVFWVHGTGTDTTGSTPQNIPLTRSPDQDPPQDDVGLLDAVGQFVRYGRIFAPRYRKANFATFSSTNQAEQASLLGLAANDVIAAFIYYLNHDNHGEQVIYVGHSQGAVTGGMLLRKIADNNAAIRNKIRVAVLSGLGAATFRAYTSPTSTTGGWWQNIPICQAATDKNCIMTWMTWEDGQTVPLPPSYSLIYNPQLVSAGYLYKTADPAIPKPATRVWFDPMGYPTSTTTPPASMQAVPMSLFTKDLCSCAPSSFPSKFVAYQNMWQGYNYNPGAKIDALMLKSVAASGDVRVNPLTYSSTLGYHLWDMNLPMQDVLNLLDQKIK